MVILNITRNTYLAVDAKMVTGQAAIIGLSHHRHLPNGEGLLLYPCHSITTEPLTFPIDVIFVDRFNRISAAFSNIQPHSTATSSGAVAAIELPVGVIAHSQSKLGDQLSYRL